MQNIFLFLRPVTNTALSKSFTNTHFPTILWDWTSHIIKFLRMQYKILPKTLHTFNKIVCFSSAVFFPSFILCLLLLKCSDANLSSLSLIIFRNINWCTEKDKTPEAVYLFKVSNKDTTSIIESCSMWRYMSLFLHPLFLNLYGHKLSSRVFCHLWALFAYETFH